MHVLYTHASLYIQRVNTLLMLFDCVPKFINFISACINTPAGYRGRKVRLVLLATQVLRVPREHQALSVSVVSMGRREREVVTASQESPANWGRRDRRDSEVYPEPPEDLDRR